MGSGVPSGGRHLSAVSPWLSGRAIVPGLATAVSLALVASLVATQVPGPIGAVPLAVILGLLLGRLLPRSALEPGYGFASGPLLRAGIVMLGAELSLTEIARVGVPAIGLVFGALLLAGVVVWSLARLLGIGGPLVVLLAVGSAVCGNTAILAVAPAVRADRRDVALAVTGITLWGTVALLSYPVIGRLVGLPDVDFGLWAGLSIQDTSQVVAAGAAYSDEALRVATVVKLVRNSTLMLILPLVARRWRRQADAASPQSPQSAFPIFVLGFIAMAALRSVGLIGDELAGFLAWCSGWAVLVAVAGLGLGIELRGMRSGAVPALAVAAAAAAALGVLGFGAASLDLISSR